MINYRDKINFPDPKVQARRHLRHGVPQGAAGPAPVLPEPEVHLRGEKLPQVAPQQATLAATLSLCKRGDS